MMDALALRDELVRALSALETVRGIGQTGSLDAALVPGRSDIDLFVVCEAVPEEGVRRACYRSLPEQRFDLHMNVCTGGRWGWGDILVLDGVDVMPMYFTVAEMRAYLLEVLGGSLEKEGRFYPVGRLASVASLHILHEKDGAWSELQELVNRKPEAFFRRWYAQEIGQVLDEEDLGRCELRREVLFAHQVMENALDHLLQALYAVNGCYFPSRKRTLSALQAFEHTPRNCGERLLSLVRLAAAEESLPQAIDELRRLTDEVGQLGEKVFPQEQITI